MNFINENLLYIIWFLSVGIFVTLFFILRVNDEKRRKTILRVVSLIPAGVLLVRILFFTIRGYAEGGADFAFRQFAFGLPGHLCGTSSTILPIAVWAQKKRLLDYTYYIAAPAALFAILLNSSVGKTVFLSDLDTYIFWFPHLIYLCVPIYMIIFEGLRPSLKTIPSAIGIVIIIMLVDHLINTVVNRAFNEYVINYMYTLGPGDFIPNMGAGLIEKNFHEIVLLRDIWSFWPVEFFYMFLLIPMLSGVSLLLYLPFKLIKKNREE